MSLFIVIELCVLAFALNTVSAIRGYVYGEALWSKVQRDASLRFRLYAYSGDKKNHRNFVSYFQAPLGEHQEAFYHTGLTHTPSGLASPNSYADD